MLEAGRADPLPRATPGSRLARVLAGLLGRTCRPRVLTPGPLEQIIARGEPVIFVGWHQQIFLMLLAIPRLVIARGIPITVLISRSRDGDLGHRLAVAAGAEVVRGSSSRGGGAAVRKLHRALSRSARSPLIIPDGPRGPARKPKRGVVALARLTGAPVVPIAVVSSRSWRLRSWDRTVVPKPLSALGLALGPAAFIARDEEGEEAAERFLGSLSEVLDRLEGEAMESLRVRR